MNDYCFVCFIMYYVVVECWKYTILLSFTFCFYIKKIIFMGSRMKTLVATYNKNIFLVLILVKEKSKILFTKENNLSSFNILIWEEGEGEGEVKMKRTRSFVILWGQMCGFGLILMFIFVDLNNGTLVRLFIIIIC